jgi:23S rRNA C2498 (ribose-2'-O)-methylase RlmM
LCVQSQIRIAKFPVMFQELAYYKLQEAFERFFGDTEDYDCSCSLLKSKVALDCGAAPGGWTNRGNKVYSIDPGTLLYTQVF